MSRLIQAIPSNDKAFQDAASGALSGLDSALDDEDVASALTELLRVFYPHVDVHRQHELARLAGTDVWYAYRDGRAGSGSPEWSPRD